MDGVTQGLRQLPASVSLGSKLQDLQRDRHPGGRNDNVCSVSVCGHTLVKAERKLCLQQGQVLTEVSVSSTEAGVEEEEREQERPHGGGEGSCSSEGRGQGEARDCHILPGTGTSGLCVQGLKDWPEGECSFSSLGSPALVPPHTQRLYCIPSCLH